MAPEKTQKSTSQTTPVSTEKSSLILFAHPKKDSFCAACAEALREAFENRASRFFYHDLYAEGFDPVLSLSELESKGSFDPLCLQYMKEVETSQNLFLVFPEWWGGFPAILSGWFDRVFRPGVAYDYRGQPDEKKTLFPLLTSLTIHCVLTSEQGPLSSPSVFVRLKQGIGNFCGAKTGSILSFGPVRDSSYSQRQKWLRQAAALAI